MITLNDSVELKATISVVGGDNFTISISEILVDSKWEKFITAKSLNVLMADYDSTVLTPTEKELYKKMLTSYGSTLTDPDDIATATSANSKL